MAEYQSSNQRRIIDEFDEKEDISMNGGSYSCVGDGSTASKSTHDDQAHDRRRVQTRGEEDLDSGTNLSEQDENRLREAFFLAAAGELDGDEVRGYARIEREEVQLPTHGPTCLRKFAMIVASLGLKTTREELRRDFEQVVHSHGLVTSDPDLPWGGAYDTQAPVTGFTYKVFKRYYLNKIQKELCEADILEAWEDLHYGTGSKRITPVEPAAAINSPVSSGTAVGANNGTPMVRGESLSDGRAYVTRAELQKILTREGETLTDEEVDELLRECRPDDQGRIVYEGYRRMLIEPSP